MARIFLSHSSANRNEAVALRDWLSREGWKDDIFLDLDPERGLIAGDRWELALNKAANRCEAVLFLVSRDWLASIWCRKEMQLAHRLNKRIFGVLIENLSVDQVPADIRGEWQMVRLASGRDHVMLRAVIPVSQEEVVVTFSAEGLARLKLGLEQAGLDARHFDWPPESEPNRPPYRGLLPLEADDAGIFFGRDAPVIEALDRLRGLRESAPPRLLAIIGASGAGKSSMLRAGLLPRVARDKLHFLPLPIVRPHRAVLTGEAGFVRSLELALRSAGIQMARAEVRAAVDNGASMVRPLLQKLVDEAQSHALDEAESAKRPMIVLPIDQGEELFLADGQEQASGFLRMLHDLLAKDAPALIALFTIRSDNYERLQLAPELEEVQQSTMSLPPMPKGSYAEVIRGLRPGSRGRRDGCASRTVSLKRCLRTAKAVVPRTRCPCSRSPFSASMPNTTQRACSSSSTTKSLDACRGYRRGRRECIQVRSCGSSPPKRQASAPPALATRADTLACRNRSGHGRATSARRAESRRYRRKLGRLWSTSSSIDFCRRTYRARRARRRLSRLTTRC